MAVTKSNFPQNFNSFSGVDIRGVFGGAVIAELQAISYSVTREKAPIYTMGSADPRAFSRGKRGIAGTLIFIMFDRVALLDNMKDLQFVANQNDIRPGSALYSDVGVATKSASGQTQAENAAPGVRADSFNDSVNAPFDNRLATPWFTDQIPPFDITLAAANEYGSMAVMRVYGAELLNEGYGVSVDDIVSEQQHTYIARTLVGWKALGNIAAAPTTPV